VQLDKTILFLWLSKIVYSIKFAELFLKVDRKIPDSDPIMTKDYLEGSYALHVMLQGVWRGIDFGFRKPAYSVLVVNLHSFEETKFNFSDNLYSNTVCFQLGTAGVIAALQDFGVITSSYGRYVEAVSGCKLHPIQFDELFAKVTYQSRLIENVPFYQFVVSENSNLPIQVNVLNSPIVKNWNQADYYDSLSFYLSAWSNIKLEFLPPDKVTTFMTDENNNLLLLNADGSLANTSK
jgi:hypothetical protein